MRDRVESTPGRTAFIFDEVGESTRTSYADLDARARAVAVALRERAAPGDRALLLLAPGIDYLSAFFGCLYAGVIAIPAYPPTGRDAGRLLARLGTLAGSARPAVVVTHDDARSAGRAALDGRLSADTRWLGVDGVDRAAGDRWSRPVVDEATVAFIQYTSGSTAQPRGVVLSHANLLSNLFVVAARFGTGPESIGCSWLPPYHDMGLIGAILQPVYRGFPMVLMTPESFVRRPAAWLRAISRHRVTVSGAPDFAYELCVRRVSEADRATLDLSSWRVAFSGAEPVRAETLGRFTDAFAGVGFRRTSWYPCYGLAEATLMVSAGAPDRAPVVGRFDTAALARDEVRPSADGRPMVSCGPPADDHTVLVVDPRTGRPQPSGRVGELWVHGPSVASGYWDDPAATAETFGARVDDDPTGPAFLRTGDLGFRHDGELYVAGRCRDVVVVRGRNHYPADVEATVAACHPAMRMLGVVFAVPGPDGAEAVVAVHEVRPGASGADLTAAAEAARQAVATDHGLHLARILLVGPGEVPRTSSGKPQRSACRARFLDGELTPRHDSRAGSDPVGAGDAVPVTDEASVVLRILALAEEPAARRTLVTTYLRLRLAASAGVPPEAVAPDRPVGTLGLDSLRSIELLERVRDELGGDLTVDMLLGDATPVSLAEILTPPGYATTAPADVPAAVDRPVRRADPAAPAPLSFAQQRLWFMHQINPDSAAYHIAAAFRLSGQLRVPQLATAVRAVVADHEALRTAICTDRGVPVQIVLPTVDLPLEVVDGSGGPDAVRERLGEWARRPFRLDEAPLVRAAIVALSVTEHIVALVGHHVVFDAASVRILLTAIGRAYAAGGDGTGSAPPAGTVGPADFAAWQRSSSGRAARREHDLAYWRERLRGVPPLGLPCDRPRPIRPTTRGAGEPLTVPAAVAERVLGLARDRGVTPFMVLLAAWKVLLLRHSGQPDITVGVPVSNRDTPGVGGAVGCFVDTLVLRTGLHGDPTFESLLDRVRATAQEAYAHPAAPFDRLVEELNVERHANRNPLFEASFSMFPDLGVSDALPGTRAEVVEIETGYAQFDLVLEMMWSPAGLRGRIRYTTDLYDRATARRLCDHLNRLLAGVTAEPGWRLSGYPLQNDAEWDRLRAGQPRADPHGPVREPLHEPFEAHSRRHPDDVALVDGRGRRTYGEVDARANRIAHLLRGLGVGPEVRVGLSIAASAELVTALLGILKSGGAYVPVEPTDPPARIHDLLTDSGARVVLTDSAAVGSTLDGTGIEVVRVDLAGDRIDRQPATRPDGGAGPHHLAYVIFTSGSTGRPKGVAVEHRQIVSFLRATEGYLAPRRGDRYAMLSSIAADLGLTTLLPALRTGGTVHVVTRATAADPVQLAATFGATTLDHLKIAPSHLSALLAVPGGAAILPVRTLVLGGEAVSWELVDRVRTHRPDTAVLNEYGPTETAVANIVHRVRPDGTDRRTPLVPMSVSLGGNRAYVLDAHLRPVPVGVPGELFLGGPQVARGYLNRPATTAERFRPDPYTDVPGARMYATGDRVRWLDESTMEYYGRIDNQVKVRGHRVEPGEIEGVLRQHEAVRDAVVLSFATAAGDHTLVGYVIPTEESAVDEMLLRTYLRARLPGHLVPGHLVLLPDLPVLAHGKVDRDALRALPRPVRPAAAPPPPTDPIRRTLVEIWCDTLGLEHVRVDDNFFDVGGHSLLLVTLQHHINERFGRAVSVVDLMVNPTIDTQAAHLAAVPADGGTGTPAADPAVARAQARRDGRRRRDTRGGGRW